MSKDVDRNKVFQTTRVRTALRNDVSWIHQPKDTGGRDKAGTSHEVPKLSFKGTSYVLLAVKKFDNSGNTDVISGQKNTQPEGTKMETTGETEPHAPTGELLQNVKAQAETLAANTTVEIKEEYGDAAVDRSNVETFAEVSADVHVEEPVSLPKESPEAVSPVKPAEQPLSSTAAEIKEHVDTPADPTNAEQNEAKVSADANVANTVADVSAVDGTVENKTAAAAAEVPPAPIVKLECEEKSLIETDPAKATNLTDASVETSVNSRESCEDIPEQTTEYIVVYAAKVMVDSLPETTEEINATTEEEEASLQTSVESVPDLLVESVTKSPPHPADESESSEKCPQEDTKGETVAAAAELIAELLPEAIVVNNTTPGEESSLQASTETVPDLLVESISKSPTPPADEMITEKNGGKCSAEQDTREPPSLAPPVITATPEESIVGKSEEPVLDTQLKPGTQPAAETIEATVVAVVESSAEIPVAAAAAETEVCCEESVPEGVTKHTAPSETDGESVKIPAVNITVSGEETSLQDGKDSFSDTQLETETSFESSHETFAVESATQNSEEPVPDTQSSLLTQPVETEASSEISPLEDLVPGSQNSSPAEVVAETETSDEKSQPVEVEKETIEAVNPTVNNATKEEMPLQKSEEPVSDSTEPSAEMTTVVVALEKSPEQDTKETVVAVAETKEEIPGVSDTTREEAGPQNQKEPTEVVREKSPEDDMTEMVATTEGSPLQSSEEPAPDFQSKLMVPPAPEQGSDETAEAEVHIGTSPEIPALATEIPAEETGLKASEDPVPVSQSALISETIAETVVSCEKCPEQQSSQETSEVEAVIESLSETPTEQTNDPHDTVEVKTEDALDKCIVDRTLELTDALDEPPTAETSNSKPVQDSKQEESIPNHSDVPQNPAEEKHSTQTPGETCNYQPACSFCNQIIDGEVKIMFSEPEINCHPECLKCGVCACALGDLLTPMFLNDHVIQCGSCFKQSLKITEAYLG